MNVCTALTIHLKPARSLFSIFLIHCCLLHFSGAAIIYVDESAGGSNDGSNWGDAYTSLQSALAAAVSGDEIWVATGTYNPYDGVFDDTATFTLKTGVELYGGFASGATDKTGRIFSYLWYEGGTILDGGGVNHVITANGIDSTAILDGFTIQQGNANGGGDDNFGGGLFISNSSPIIRNCWVLSNGANVGGGGAWVTNGSSPQFEDSTFQNCGASAFDSTGGAVLVDPFSTASLIRVEFRQNYAEAGGAIHCAPDGTVTAVSCAFESNSVSNIGGGDVYFSGSSGSLFEDCTFNSGDGYLTNGGSFWIESGSPEIVRSVFTRNGFGSISAGGAIYITNGASPLIYSNCFHGNQADMGAGIYSEDSSPVIVNNVFVGNKGVDGAAFYTTGGAPVFVNNSLSANIASGSGGGIYSATGNGEFHNLILWQNVATTGEQIFDNSLPITLTYSNVENGYAPGTAVISADPEYIESPNPGDDTTWATEDDNYGDLQLNAGYLEGVGMKSPSIDAGNNAMVPDDFADLDLDTTTAEPTPLDKLNQRRFYDVTIIGDTGIGGSPIVDHGAYETGGQIVYVCPEPGGGPPKPLSWYSASANTNAPGTGLFVHSDGLTGNAIDGSFGFDAGAGESWENPMCSIYTALALAQAGVQVWMEGGTYYMRISRGQNELECDSHELPEGVTLQGGFAGTETSPDERVDGANETILTGETETDERLRHIFTNREGNQQIFIDRLTIRDTSAGYYGEGSAVFCNGGNIQFNNVKFYDCFDGPAVVAEGDSDLSFTDSHFQGTPDGAIQVNGFYSDTANPITNITNCTGTQSGGDFSYFLKQVGGSATIDGLIASGYASWTIFLEGIRYWLINNANISNGGSLYGSYGNIVAYTPFDLTLEELLGWGTVTNCTITGGAMASGPGLVVDNQNNPDNKPELTTSGNHFEGLQASSGAGMYLNSVDIQSSNDTIVGNEASYQGGGINAFDCVGEIKDCRIEGNTAGYGGGAGTFLAQCQLTILRALIIANDSSGGFGSAMYMVNSLIIWNWVVAICNTGTADGAVVVDVDSELTATNCTVAGNAYTGFGTGGGGVLNYGLFDAVNTVLTWALGNPFSPDEANINNQGGTVMLNYCCTTTMVGSGSNNLIIPETSVFSSAPSLCDVEEVRPGPLSVLNGAGDPSEAASTDATGIPTGHPLPIGALVFVYDPTVNTEGFNDPPLITVNDTMTINVINEPITDEFDPAPEIYFLIQDPDYNETLEGRLHLSISSTMGQIRFLKYGSMGFDYTETKNPITKTGLINELEPRPPTSGQVWQYIPLLNSFQTDTITIEVSDQGYSNDGVQEGTARKDTKTITVNFLAFPYDIWRAEHFPDSYTTPLQDILDQGLQGLLWNETADPDLDGLTNEEEMRLGSDPRVPTLGPERVALLLAPNTSLSSPTPASTTTKENGIISAQSIGGEGDDVQLYARRPKLEGLEADIEFSTDLSGWNPLLDLFNLPAGSVLVDEGAEWELWQVDLSATGLPASGPYFFRLNWLN